MMKKESIIDAIPNLRKLFGDSDLFEFGDKSTLQTSILCYGQSGVGKTIFLLSLAYQCAKQGDIAIIITFAQRPTVINSQIKSFKWIKNDKEEADWELLDLPHMTPNIVSEKLKNSQNKGMLIVWSIEDKAPGYTIEVLKEVIDRIKEIVKGNRRIRFIAIDAVNRLCFNETGSIVKWQENTFNNKELSFDITDILDLQNEGVVLCLSAEVPSLSSVDATRTLILDEIMFHVNVVIELGIGLNETSDRWIQVKKARSQSIIPGKHLLKISEAGMSVFPSPETWRLWHSSIVPDVNLQHTGSEERFQFYTVRSRSTYNNDFDELKVKDVGTIGITEKTLLRGPASTQKRHFAINFLENSINAGIEPCFYDFELDDKNDRLRNYRLEHIPSIAEASPSEIFHCIVDEANERIHPYNTGSAYSRAVIANPLVLMNHGLTELETFHYIQSLVNTLRELRYTTLISQNIDYEGEWFLDSIFDNVFVTERRVHAPSGGRYPWFHARCFKGNPFENYEYYLIEIDKDIDKEEFFVPTLSSRPNVYHEDKKVIIPRLIINLHQETEPQKRLTKRIEQAIVHQMWNSGQAPIIRPFDPESADDVREGLTYREYASHQGACIINSFDEDWIGDIIAEGNKNNKSFLSLWNDDINLADKYPAKTIAPFKIDGNIDIFGLPLNLNVSLLVMDLYYLRDAFFSMFKPLENTDANNSTQRFNLESMIKDNILNNINNFKGDNSIDKNVILNILDNTIKRTYDLNPKQKKIEPDNLKTSLMTELRELAWKRRHSFVDWAWLTRLAYNIRRGDDYKENTDDWPLFSASISREETLLCFMLGYLFDVLFEFPNNTTTKLKWKKYEIRNTTKNDSNRTIPINDIKSKLILLHYTFCLVGYKEIAYNTQDLESSERTIPTPISYEWYSRFRARFGSHIKPASEHYLYFIRPNDINFFTGNWYLGVKNGGLASDMGKRIIDHVTSNPSLRKWMNREGAGLPTRGDQKDIYESRNVAPDLSYPRTPDRTYRFDIPSRSIWNESYSRVYIPGYSDIRDKLIEIFHDIINILVSGTGIFDPDRFHRMEENDIEPPHKQETDKQFYNIEYILNDMINRLVSITQKYVNE